MTTRVSSPKHRQSCGLHTAITRGVLPLLLLVALSLLSPAVAAPSCLRFADYNNINQAFTDGGPGTKVLLCPGKTYRLTGPIVFTSADQELATFGHPTGADRATLLLNGDFGTAIQGDCRRCARVTVSSLIIDGNRRKLGRIVDQALSTGLIVIGGNEGQTVDNNWIKDPRGFTAIHIREGDKLQCKGATVEKNEIGPVGEEFNPDVDGSDPEMSPLGRPLADGVSIACKDSYIRDNTFYDNTDAAVVIYGSPGTIVHSNNIHSRKLSSMAGILMVDSTPFDGDYTGTIVRNNMIDAASRIIRLGIGVGPPVWSDDTETVLKGGSVIGNGLRGKYMGYGIAAAGLDGWTIKDNWDEAVHDGERSARCFDEPINPDPVAFLHNSALIKNSELQEGFVDQPFEYVVCIDGKEDPNGYKNAPKAKAKAKPPAPAQADGAQAGDTEPAAEEHLEPEVSEATEVERFSTGSEVMDDILEHSQARMLDTIDGLARRVVALADAANANSDVTHRGQVVMSPQIAGALGELQVRVASLESRQKIMLDTATGLRSALKSWDIEMAGVTEWQYEVLLDVQHRLNLYKPNRRSGHKHDKEHDEHEDDDEDDDDHALGERKESGSLLTDRSRIVGSLGIHDPSWVQPLRYVFAQAIFMALVVVVRRWWKGRERHGKSL